jgi:NAD(P)-dependent dehydrogenase (short-subunit alcohol dehydrogenase family)
MSQPLVWLVTGTSSGFGKELSIALLERGDKVIATARSRSLAKLSDLKERGASILELDVTAPLDNLHDVAKKAIAIHGRLDVLVNNAGYIAFGALEENTPEETLGQFNTNVFGGLNVARAFLPYMRERKTGTVVWIGSVGGYRGGAAIGLYIATKYAVRGISESLHQEISPLGLRSIIFEPGYFRTEFLTDDNRAPWISRISDYEPITTKVEQGLVAYNGNQLGDPKKGVQVMIDVVKGEGVAANKPFDPVVLLGSDCYRIVRGILEKSIERMDDWKEISGSTDHENGGITP